MSLPLVAADACAAILATTIAYCLTAVMWPASELSWMKMATAVTLSVIVVNHRLGLYPGAGLSAIAEVRLTTLSTLYATMVFMLMALPLVDDLTALRAFVPAMWVLLMVLAPLVRLPIRALCSCFRWWGQPALILGNDPNAVATYSYLRRNPRLGLRPMGIFGGREEDDQLDGLLEAHDAMNVAGNACLVVTVPRRTTEGVQSELRYYWASSSYMMLAHLQNASTVGTQAQGFLDRLPGEPHPYRSRTALRLVKRLFDLVAVTIGGVLILPLIVLIALLIKVQSPGPVFFRQDRMGHNGRRFKVWKFRTMVTDANTVLAKHIAENPAAREEWETNRKLRNDPRITGVGRFLRKTSLDELPQLWNVLRGEMTLVGPRPIEPEEVVKYGDRFSRYCAVMPGMTGLWQVSGRNDTSYEARVDMDSYYATNWSLLLDLYILVLTIKVVLFRQGAY